MTKRKKLPQANAAVQQISPVPQWVIEMREYFQRTGVYRPEDLQRVLGDPRDSVQVQLDTGRVLLSRYESEKN